MEENGKEEETEMKGRGGKAGEEKGKRGEGKGMEKGWESHALQVCQLGSSVLGWYLNQRKFTQLIVCVIVTAVSPAFS